VSILVKVRTAYSLGIVNIVRAIVYRLSIKYRLGSATKVAHYVSEGLFFRPNLDLKLGVQSLLANDTWWNQHLYFGWHKKQIVDLPDWCANCFTGVRLSESDKSWWQIADFDTSVGDIKTIWEASRFDWVLCMSQLGINGDLEAFDRLNAWLTDWVDKNPPYYGPNWKCGQEASFRVLHLATAALMVKQIESAEQPLVDLIVAHMKRIKPTLAYAIAQENNHGTSEAAALFIGGSWLESLGHPEGRGWKLLGAQWLENRVRRLFQTDGSFSQHSSNYHRLALDTYSIVEVWRRHQNLPPFTKTMTNRLSAATQWLYQMTDIGSGDVPNVGANDGARLLPLAKSDFRDFRSTVQLAAVLFSNKRAFTGEGDWNLPLAWLSIPIPKETIAEQISQEFDNGGYMLLRKNMAMVLFRYPRFAFRPSQSDILHVDFWLAGSNLLRDGGSYSYNTGDDLLAYFSGTASHNTIQFDNRDQMPRLGRFLFGDWLKTEELIHLQNSGHGVMAGAGYSDSNGAKHHRLVELSASTLKVTDTISGFSDSATLRWRLAPGTWRQKGQSLLCESLELSVTTDIPDAKYALLEGIESRYYMKKERLPVFEIALRYAGTITTVLRF